MRILGITGGIATGKSTVTRVFAELGAPTASADQIARDLLAPGTEMTLAVLAAFPSVLSSVHPDLPTVDRRALSQIVFADEESRKRLESLTHPGIRSVMRAWIDARRQKIQPRAGAIEIPLLFESHLEAMVDEIIVVACDEMTQIARLCERLKIGQDEARAQIASQWPLADKIARADIVIRTDGSLESVKQQVQDIWDGISAA